MLASAEQAPAAQPRAAAPERGTCAYTACYCEENALLLSKRLAGGCAAAAEHLYVVFVTNRLRQAPLWCQRAGRDEDGLVVWDYHVFVIEAPRGGLRRARVWDLDTRLPFPCTLEDYAEAALPPVREQYSRVYRVVPAAQCWRHFASDRSHMRTPSGGWSAPPPPYPPFVAESDGCTNRLQAYLDVSEAYAPAETLASGGGDGAHAAGGMLIHGSSGAGGAGGGDGAAASRELGFVMREEDMLRFFGVE